VSFYSVWPFFVELAAAMLLIATPLFAAADAPPSPHPRRLKTLDGLRGFLALGVFFHHVAVYHRYLIDGAWISPPAIFYACLGKICVLFFFMITGYLFWSRLIRERGTPSWLKLYVGRVFRIGPLYLFTFACMAFAAFALTGFYLQVSISTLCKELSVALSLGIVQPHNINAFSNTALLINAVTWSLRDEWIFYLCLPFVAIFARRKGWHLPIVAGLLAVVMLVKLFFPSLSQCDVPASFLWGMLCASLLATNRVVRVPDTISSTAVAVLLFISFIARSATSFHSMLCMGITFYLINTGCSFFGLLTTTPARRLGDVSYGIYLLQGLPQALFFRPPFFASIALASPLGHWSLALLATLTLVGLATLTHVYIERPGIALGRLVAQKLSHHAHTPPLMVDA
jgi:peptidoglycan/LPS O-acetylase OafA/YrhL